MATDGPFLLTKVECPICKTVNEFELIRVGAYAEDGRDTDFCPLNVKWRFPRYQGYNPLVFFTATCTNCYYSRELTNDYKDWKNDTNFRTYRLKSVKEKHLEQLSTSESVIKTLGSKLDINRYPNESAILKLLLAINDEQMYDHYSRLDIGRFYLRIAWLFRDLERGENPSLLMLRGMVHELDDQYSRLRNSFANVAPDLDGLQALLLNHLGSDALSAEVKGQMYAFKERFDQQITGLHQAVNEAEQKLLSLNSIIDDYRVAALGGTEGGEGGNGFAGFPSFAMFLAGVQKRWSGVVTNEREALVKAVAHYREAFANGKDIAQGNQQLQASYLIAELSRRVGDRETAKQYFTSTIKAGQEFIYQNRNDQARTALARKIMELAIEQGRSNLASMRPA